jgi:filamentous hemagglutinin
MAGPAKPWFGYTGMGTQYKFDQSIRSLLESGALAKKP